MKVLIIYPTPFEAGAFFEKYAHEKPAVGSLAKARFGETEIYALVCGYGCAATVERVKKRRDELLPDMAFLCGFCGSCSPDIGKCDYLFETGSDFLKPVFESMGASPVRIACSDKFAGFAEKQDYFKSGFHAVDMESALLIGLFGFRNFGSFRCVSDELESDVPEDFFHLLIDRETGGDRSLGPAVIKLFFKKPSDLLRLVRFAKDGRQMKRGYDAKALALVEALAAASQKKTGFSE